MRRYSFLLVVVAAGLLAASSAQSRLSTTAATATFAVEGLSVDFTLTNTGADPIKCMRVFMPEGTIITSLSGPPGTNSEGPAVFSNGSLNIPPGGSATWKLETSPALSSAKPPRVNVSSNCKDDAGAKVVVVAKAALKPCECKNIQTRTSGWGDIQASGGGPTRFSFRLQWSMNCGGTPGDCKGEIDVTPPGDVKLSAPKKATIGCSGKCLAGQALTLTKGTVRVAGTSAATLDSDARGGKSFTFRFDKYCIRDGKRVKAGRGFITVAYRANGLLDLQKSDLNGDLKPDKGRR